MSLKSKLWMAVWICLFILPMLASLAQDTGTGGAEATAEATGEATPEATAAPGSTVAIIIVIEGPVEEVNINIITIFGIDIEVDADDPALTVIQIGDILRIEGELNEDDEDDEDDNHITLVAITIVFINVEVIVVDGQVWRDPGNCDNPPPPWAPAHGWRKRCETAGGGGGDININITVGGGGDDGSGSGSGMGMGMGMGMGR